MVPGRSHITLYQGDDFSYYFRLRGATWNPALNSGAGGWVPGAYLNLTGHTVKAQVRKTAEDESVLAEFEFTLAAQSGDTLGGVLLTLAGDATAAVPPTIPGKEWVWDVEITKPDGSNDTYLSGKVRTLAQVTRP